MILPWTLSHDEQMEKYRKMKIWIEPYFKIVGKSLSKFENTPSKVVLRNSEVTSILFLRLMFTFFSYFSEECNQKIRKSYLFQNEISINQQPSKFTVRMYFIIYIKQVSEYFTLPPLQLMPGSWHIRTLSLPAPSFISSRTLPCSESFSIILKFVSNRYCLFTGLSTMFLDFPSNTVSPCNCPSSLGIRYQRFYLAAIFI